MLPCAVKRISLGSVKSKELKTGRDRKVRLGKLIACMISTVTRDLV